MNQDLHERRAAAISRGMSTVLPIYAARASNAELWDEDGRRYVDFAGGIAVVNTGHVHPEVSTVWFHKKLTKRRALDSNASPSNSQPS